MMMHMVWTMVGMVVSAGPAQALVTDGGFEQMVAAKNPYGVDQGFGLWRLKSDQRPKEWRLNTAYPGELTVRTTGAHAGQHCVHVRGTGERQAHLFQMVPGVRPGQTYKVSAWVRKGTVSLLFYEYMTAKKIGAQNVARGGARGDRWRQIIGYYRPPATGFKRAAMAVVVEPGTEACIDDVAIEAMATPPTPPGLKPIMLENDAVRLTLSPGGGLQRLVCKATGTDYAVPDQPLAVFEASDENVVYPCQWVQRRGDVITARFVDPAVRVSVRVTSRPTHFQFEVVDAQPASLERVTIRFPVRPLKTYAWAMNGVHDDRFGVCLMAVTPNVHCAPRGLGTGVSLTAKCLRRHGLRGARMALVAAPRDGYLPAIRDMQRATGLPCVEIDGQWIRTSRAIKQSYLFAIGCAEEDFDKLIEYAKVGHFGTILILKNAFLKTHGHYEINTANFPDGLASLKRVADKVHAAGLKIGVHVFGPTVSPDDPYVTPKPDERLYYVPCPPLAKAVDAKGTVLTLAAQPDTLPPRRGRNRAFPGYHVRVGDEIVRYSGVDVGPPFRFTECQRGALGTPAGAHASGTRVRGMLSMWGFFVYDPDSPILDEITTNFAKIVNTCKLDMVYVDASDGTRNDYLDRWYYMQKCHLAQYRKFDHGVLYQTSMGTGSGVLWHFVARSASADGHGDLKWYLDQRLAGILGMKRTFTARDIGWYGLDMHWKPDQLEYVCAKCIGADGSISVQANRRILENHPRAREIMEMLGRYERCRLAGFFPDPVRAKLLEKEKDVRLFDDGPGKWKLYRAAYGRDHLIAAVDGKGNVWTLVNDRKHPCRVAIEIERPSTMFSNGTVDYTDPAARVVDDFADAAPYAMSTRNQYEKYVQGGGKVLTPHGPVSRGVTQKLGRAADGAGTAHAVYSAKNVGHAGGWCGKGRRFAKPLDLSAYKALALRVHGDGAGERFYFQLRDTRGRWANFPVEVHFRGWRLCVFRTTSQPGFDWKAVDYLILYFNSIGAKRSVSVGLDALKAFRTVRRAPDVSGLELVVGERRLRFPTALRRGQCLTTDGLGTCTLWPGGMRPGRTLDVPGADLVVPPGKTKVVFTCADPKRYPGDVSVRLSRIWPMETD